MYFLLVIKREKKPIKNKERERRNFVLLEANYWIQEMFGNKNLSRSVRKDRSNNKDEKFPYPDLQFRSRIHISVKLNDYSILW